MDNKRFLTEEKMSSVLKIIISEYDLFISRDNKVSNEVEEYIATLYAENKIHYFFLNMYLYTNIDRIFSNESIRDFLLAYTDKVSILLSTEEVGLTKIINSIVNAVAKENDNSLIPEGIKEQLQVSAVDIRTILENNTWYLCLFLLVISFTGTISYKKISGEQVK